MIMVLPSDCLSIFNGFGASPRMHQLDESSFSPRLDALEHCTSRAIPKVMKKNNLPRGVVYIALNAHQKLKLRLISREYRGEFESEVANGVIAEAT
jgi:hypothetical protein